MDDVDISPDTVMILAGIVLSLIALLELYPAWKRARTDGDRAPARGDDQSLAEE